MKVCPRCGKSHEKDGVYCSRSCANIREHSAEVKQKISHSLKTSGKRFQPPPRLRKPKPSKIKKPTGGYREGSGRGKCGYYKGVFCNSTYELVFVICCFDHDIKFERFGKLLTDGKLNYYPEFIVDGKLIEIKGFDYDGKVDAKTNLAISLGFEIEVLYKKDLSYCFQWVRNNYSYRAVEELYDNHVPKYTYQCDCCGSIFSRQKRATHSKTYCSRSCSLKGNRQVPFKKEHTDQLTTPTTLPI